MKKISTRPQHSEGPSHQMPEGLSIFVVLSFFLAIFSVDGLVMRTYASTYNEKPLLIAQKREVIIPAEAKKKSCSDIEKELIRVRKEYIATMEFENKKKSKTQSDHQLENKRGQNEVKLAKEKANRQMKVYKLEEAKLIFDTYNSSIDTVLDTREKAFSTALKNYRTATDAVLGKISPVYKKYIKNIKKIVCTASGVNKGILNGLRESSGFFALTEMRTAGLSNVIEILQNGRKTANNTFKTAMRNAEKVKNDALKLLKKIK